MTQVPGSPFASGSSPIGIAFTPVLSGGLFAAVTNSADNNVSVFNVNQTTGTFTQIPGSPFPVGANPNTVVFSGLVSGVLLAAIVNFDTNNVSVFEVNQTTGVFTEIFGSPFATGVQPDGIAFSPLVHGNLFAGVANFGDGTASAYQVTLPVVQPPSNVNACKNKNIFLTQIDLINVITWNPPTSGPAPVTYYIYRDAALTQLAGTVAATQPLIFIDHNRHKDVTYTYYLVSEDADNNVSVPVSVTPLFCCCN